MSVRQYYYTSYVDTRTGHSGFRVKALSPGIPPDLQTTLARLIAYRTPPSLDSSAINIHPVALRFYNEGTGQCVLLCCQSCGTDEYGRPGNFFAHALILEPDIFTHIPPIFFWKSPFWQMDDPEPRDCIASLPTLPSFAAQPSLNVDQVWKFIAQNDRYQFLYKLLCALINGSKTQQRIIILDTCEHVAMWIAAISCLLPPQYRPFLTFATYHHDLSQSHYLITGTTRDFLYTSHEDRLSCFVFDAETGQTGPVEPSLYAEMVIEAVHSNRYEALLPLFATYARRFSAPTAINEQLNRLALYTRLQQTFSDEALTSETLEIIRTVLPSFAELPADTSTQEDTAELVHIECALRNALRISYPPLLRDSYERVLTLLGKRSFPVPQLILEELLHFSRHLLMEHQGAVAHLDVSRLCQVYGEERVIATINSPAYLSWLADSLSTAASSQLVKIWASLGCSIQPLSHSEGILRSSLSTAASLFQQQHATQLRTLLHVMVQAMQKQSLAWLQLLVRCYNDQPVVLLSWLYRLMIAPLSLEQRIPYRAIVLPLYQNVLEDEVCNDIDAAAPDQRMTIIELWAEHADLYHYQRATIVQKGLEQLFQGNSQEGIADQQWQMRAMQVLENERLAPLPELIEMRLVLLAFAAPTPAHFAPTGFALCQKYQNTVLPDTHGRAVIESVIALSNGVITLDQVEQIRSIMATQHSEAYLALLQPALTAFFCHDITHETHLHLIWSLFPRSVDLMITDNFWQIYLDIFASMLRQPAYICRAIDLLDFWFSISPHAFSSSYPLQQFFLLLSMHTSFSLHCDLANQDSAFDRIAASRQWYPSISTMFTKTGSLFASLSQRLSAQWQTHIAKANAKKNRADSLKAEIDKLFTSKDVLKQHQLCSQLYEELSPRQFWSHYWKRFIALLTARDIDRLLAIFSFWFDHAADVVLPGQYMQQEFFLGMPQAIEAAKRLPSFLEAAHTMHLKGKPFYWYPLIAALF